MVFSRHHKAAWTVLLVVWAIGAHLLAEWLKI